MDKNFLWKCSGSAGWERNLLQIKNILLHICNGIKYHADDPFLLSKINTLNLLSFQSLQFYSWRTQTVRREATRPASPSSRWMQRRSWWAFIHWSGAAVAVLNHSDTQHCCVCKICVSKQIWNLCIFIICVLIKKKHWPCFTPIHSY